MLEPSARPATGGAAPLRTTTTWLLGTTFADRRFPRPELTNGIEVEVAAKRGSAGMCPFLVVSQGVLDRTDVSGK
jgi:hypothetical protein